MLSNPVGTVVLANTRAPASCKRRTMEDDLAVGLLAFREKLMVLS